ncbi:hypothetical protein RESH_06150 [Rhodopirellula europaea SH398]|uniref:Uncharacterized protein n=1 Tax=Rhodopirellula europaea SH398 TaxID=1263868 RepID=M5RV76_9BACT|nr:hypothetical protein RESH_06150 [Rhodopirellula europaea SH398]
MVRVSQNVAMEWLETPFAENCRLDPFTAMPVTLARRKYYFLEKCA